MTIPALAGLSTPRAIWAAHAGNMCSPSGPAHCSIPRAQKRLLALRLIPALLRSLLPGAPQPTSPTLLAPPWPLRSLPEASRVPRSRSP